MALTSSKPRSEKVPSRTVNDTKKKKQKKQKISETGPKQRKSKLANTKVISENIRHRHVARRMRDYTVKQSRSALEDACVGKQ